MPTHEDELRMLMSDYVARVRDGRGKNYAPDPATVIRDFAARRGLDLAASVARLLTPFRERVAELRFENDAMHALATEAHGQLHDKSAAVVLSTARVAELAEKWALTPARAGVVLCQLRKSLTDALERTARGDEKAGKRARDELGDRLLTWLRPMLSDRLRDDVRLGQGSTGYLAGQWFILAGNAFREFPLGDYDPRGVDAFFLSFMKSRAEYAIRDGNEAAKKIKTRGVVNLGDIGGATADGATRVPRPDTAPKKQATTDTDAHTAGGFTPRADEAVPAHVPSDCPDVMESLEVQDIHAAIRALGEPFRTAMTLKIDGTPLDEIARRLQPLLTDDMPRDVRHILRTARADLEKALGDSPSDD